MELFNAVDILTYGLAAVGGALAVLWIYNSTVKERREMVRRARRYHNPALSRHLRRGAFYQRLGFCAAAVLTGLAILWFASRYHNRYGVNIASGYFVLAVVLTASGLIGATLSFLWRKKE